MIRGLIALVLIFLIATFPATWLLMLFFGNVGLNLSYWGTFPMGILVSVLLSGPYIALDRRDLLAMNALPLAGIGIIMWVAGLDRFTVVNASIFIVLSVARYLLARIERRIG